MSNKLQQMLGLGGTTTTGTNDNTSNANTTTSSVATNGANDNAAQNTGNNSGNNGSNPHNNGISAFDSDVTDLSIEDFASLWEQNQQAADTNAEALKNATNNTGQQQDNVNQDQEAALNKHIDSLDLVGAIDDDAFSTALENGDIKGVKNQIALAVNAAYKQAIIDAARVSEQRSDVAVNRAVEKAMQNQQAFSNTAQLFSKYPYMEAAAIRPVAEQAFNNFLRMSNNNVVKSAEMTNAYLSQMTSTANASDNSNGMSSFGTDNGSAEGNTDFTKFL